MRPRWAPSSRSEKILQRWYPFGIPLKSRQQPAPPVAKKITEVVKKVLFIAEVSDMEEAGNPFSGAQGELLLKAVQQGLNWEPQHVDLIFVKNQEKKNSAVQNAEQLKKEIVQRKPTLVVALGASVQKILSLKGAEKNQATPEEREGMLYFSSADLREVKSDLKVKRVFWNDLKLIAAHYAGQQSQGRA